jgi:hypothetical protein
MMLLGSDALFDFSVQGVPEGIVFPRGSEGHTEDSSVFSARQPPNKAGGGGKIRGRLASAEGAAEYGYKFGNVGEHAGC